MNFFADIEVPNDAIVHAIPALLWILFFILLCLGIWNQGKKAFGRKPPIAEELKSVVKLLKSEIHREKNSVLKETRLKISPLEKRLADSEQKISEIEVDRTRKWGEWKDEIHALDSKVERFFGRVESILKKLEGK